MPRMTEQEYTSKLNEILSDIPQDFHSYISYSAYERGHSAGYEEVVMIAGEIAYELRPAIEAYKRTLLECPEHYAT